MESQVALKEDIAMDRVIQQERAYILNLVNKIAASGCNVLLVQKSILRDALTELSLHYLAKRKILVVKDIEREDVEFICKTIGCIPIAHIDQFVPEKLGKADLCEEVHLSGEKKVLKITGVSNQKAISILLRGSNQLVLDEAERSLHDALCVVRSLVKLKSMIAGGGAIETEIAVKLMEKSYEITGIKQLIVQSFAKSLEVIPLAIAENAGFMPIDILTELRAKHAIIKGKNIGIDIKKGLITDTYTEGVIQPTLVTESALKLATECVRSIMKIDEVVLCK